MQEHQFTQASYAGIDTQTVPEQRLFAGALWDALLAVHADLNAIARRKPTTRITELENRLLIRLFAEINDVVGASYEILSPIAQVDAEYPTVFEALMQIGEYKTALRLYRQQVLRENPFSF